MNTNYSTQKVSLFKNLQSIPSVTTELKEVLRLVKYDSGVKGATEIYRKMKAVLGKDKADEEVKSSKMPAISVAVIFDGIGRKADHITAFTGLALVDLDHIADDDDDNRAATIEAVRQKIMADPHTLMCYVTASGNGFRILYRYQRVTTTPSGRRSKAKATSDIQLTAASWPVAFQKGNRYFTELTGHAYDAQCGDYSRLCGLAHDELVYVNWAAEPFVITDDEMLTANFNAKGKKGKPRHDDPTGTHTTSAEQAWPRVEQELQRRQIVYQSGHHHDYVMHAAFLMNRYGVDLDELLVWAAQEWSDYDSRQRESTIRSCYRKTDDHGTWRLNRQGRKGKETSMITLPEIREWLQKRMEVSHNLLTDQLMFKLLAKSSKKKNATPRPPANASGASASQALQPSSVSPQGREGLDETWHILDERTVCSIRSQMAKDTDKRVLKNDVMDVLHSDFARLYHPVREYIDALPPWDGKDRVKELCSHVTEVSPSPSEGNVTPTPIPSPREGSLYSSSVGREGSLYSSSVGDTASKGNQTSQPPSGSPQRREGLGEAFCNQTSPPSEGLGEARNYFHWALHKWLVATVATWMYDDIVNHEIFVIIGAQGIYKTTFFRHLLPPQLRMYFWENAHNSFASKDDHLAFAENCLSEIEEIDMQNPRDISELKALATSEKVKERRPYARFSEEKPRLASLCGSGNQQHFLSDDTGNRRWLCFLVTHIDDPRTWDIDYEQLYAQLRDELRQGFRYWFNQDEQRIVEQQNQAFRIESDEEQLIRSRLRPPRTGEKITLMNAASICQFINGGIVGRGLSTRKVSVIMAKLGFNKVHTMQGNFFEVYQIPADQIQATLAMTNDTNENNKNAAPTSVEENLPF
ncbi:MAG: hypothetical protein II949_02490 [Prevotella sp.]|nr:hypothetical protein [Prevotella sp.]